MNFVRVSAVAGYWPGRERRPPSSNRSRLRTFPRFITVIIGGPEFPLKSSVRLDLNLYDKRILRIFQMYAFNYCRTTRLSARYR